ncbi:succinylglutamate desuccinylase/aspartoacylase domain-containing protein [Pararhodospirillum oryzae]|uniref:Succinylglutamate desuccinylase n=1 Tax=Pararhodospirillum oryzae TaxID=478448 RepID=A0A512H7P8_9PROT|nr:succinylglutamate desuccinylase/aspartoacylase family protein [Pararhodospirillum oryzae]GEO81483.1 succinylglutamate desuccinylase [Pararhodospirillum oryzae]
MVATTLVPLPCASPGTRRTLVVHRWGVPGGRPRIYLQAGLHADEGPGLLVLEHLAQRLDVAEAAGHLAGEVVMVPLANPIGLGQRVHDHLIGRFHLDTGCNFNRHHLDLTGSIAALLKEDLTGTPDRIRERVRAAVGAAWEAARPATADESAALRWHLFGLAFDADVALDLHCDSEAVLHVYGAATHAPEVARVAARLGAVVALLADSSGERPFDESLAQPWIALRDAWGECVPVGCLSLTVELRGSADITDDLAAADADALFGVLRDQGVVRGDAPNEETVHPDPPGPFPLVCPLTGVDMITAPVAGVVIFRAAPGDRIEVGQVVAEILDPLDRGPHRRAPLVSRAGGVLFARLSRRLVAPGDVVAKVAGPAPLAHRTGSLLTA